MAFLVLAVVAALAQHWEIEQVDSGSLGAYVAVDRLSDGTLWLAYVSHDSSVRLAHYDSVWVFENLDTGMVRPILPAEPPWGDQPFAFDIGPSDVIGVVGLGRLAERDTSGWSSEELPMSMRMPKLAYDAARRPSLTFKDSLWQGCLALKTDSGWDTNVVFHPSEDTRWFSLTRPAWRRNDNCAFLECDIWSMGGTIDGYDVGLYRRDSGTWTANAFTTGLDGEGSVFAALVDGADSIHTFWSAIDPYGTDELICDGVLLDGATEVGAACLDTAGRVQCAWCRDNRLKFTVLGKPTQTVAEADDIVWCDITTDNLSQPVIAFCRSDGSIWIAHGVGIVGQAEERQKPAPNSQQLTASVVRNVLFLPAAVEGRIAKGELLDISGRRMLDLRPGANNVGGLSPGVYFVRSEPSAVDGQRSAVPVRKVVIQR